jgi:hypothetical protein
MSPVKTTENTPMNKAFPMINRREAVYRLAVLMGGAMIGSEVFLRGDSVPDKKPMPAFTDSDRATLDAVGATVIPKTDIPGAEAVDIGAFMIMMVNDCYSEKQHAVFLEGIPKLNATSAARFGGAFTALTPEQKTELLNELDKEQSDYNSKKNDEGALRHRILLVRDRCDAGRPLHRGARRLPRRRPVQAGRPRLVLRTLKGTATGSSYRRGVPQGRCARPAGQSPHRLRGRSASRPIRCNALVTRLKRRTRVCRGNLATETGVISQRA